MRIPELGNPLTSEAAAFRWLVVVMAGGAVVLVAALVIGSAVAALVALALVIALAVFVVRRALAGRGRSGSGDEPRAGNRPENGDPG